MIGIIDYGMGNLRSVQKGFEKVGAKAEVVTTAEGIAAADKVVLPGVGAFQDAMATLREKELVEPICQAVESGKWFLGICLGLQLLFDVSYEDGEHAGLGIVSGEVKRFDFNGKRENRLKIPHMGWNALQFQVDIPLFGGLEGEPYTYFVHSYHVVPSDASVAAATTRYGYEFVSIIRQGNVMATQFHPEKSQRVGLRMLQNFAALQ
jgi:glutamine amidotransferase